MGRKVNMGDRNLRNQLKAKSRSIRIDTVATDPALALTTAATGGTVNTNATSANSIKITLNGTAYKIPVFS